MMSGPKDTSPVDSPRQSRKRYVSLGLAVLTCPCHLPLLLAVLAGTALGGWLSRYTVVVSLAMVGIFVLALLYSFGTFDRRRGVSEARASREAESDPIAEKTWSGT